ncbi:MAG: hypothetical protein ACYC9H_03360 [Sulfuricaulis sp.]
MPYQICGQNIPHHTHHVREYAADYTTLPEGGEITDYALSTPDARCARISTPGRFSACATAARSGVQGVARGREIDIKSVKPA